MKHLLIPLHLLFFSVWSSQQIHSQSCNENIPSADWDMLVRFKPADNLSQGAAARDHVVRSIFDATILGSTVNLDYWGITISKMPKENGKTLTPEQLLERIRTRFGSFLGKDFARFKEFEQVDLSGWKAGTPGTLLVFNAHFPTVPGPGIDRVAPVMLAEKTPRYWRFVTVGDHPVSGTREFGIFQLSNGRWELYTRGADRITFSLEIPLKEGIFSGADQLWESFQLKVADDITSHGGGVANTPAVHDRYCWSNMKIRVSSN